MIHAYSATNQEDHKHNPQQPYRKTTIIIIIIMGFFGSRKKNRVSASSSADKPAQAIHKIRLSIENAEKREAFLQHKMDEIVPQAKRKMAQGDKRGALFLMKRKKMYGAEIEKLENVKMTLETQALQLETAAHNQDTVQAMQTGSSAMKRLRKAFGLDQVDELMDDIREEGDMAEEISQAIATPLDPYMLDDDELMRELEELDGAATETASKKSTGFSSMFSAVTTPNKTASRPAMTPHAAKLVAA